MSNERADEFLPWRGRLTAPDALPEQGLEDKEVTWQRLAERLQERPRRLNLAWWIAAACLILAFFLPATHLFRGRVAAHVSTRIPAVPGRGTNAAAVKPETKTVAAKPEIKAAAAAAQPDRVGKPVASPVVATTGAPDTVAAIVPTIPTPLVAANVRVSDSPANPPPHHALRIVYLNELTNNDRPQFAAVRQPAFLRLFTASAGNTGNVQAGTGGWTADQAPNPLIKISISSPNH